MQNFADNCQSVYARQLIAVLTHHICVYPSHFNCAWAFRHVWYITLPVMSHMYSYKNRVRTEMEQEQPKWIVLECVNANKGTLPQERVRQRRKNLTIEEEAMYTWRV